MVFTILYMVRSLAQYPHAFCERGINRHNLVIISIPIIYLYNDIITNNLLIQLYNYMFSIDCVIAC